MADFAPPKKEELNDMFAPPDEDEMQIADSPQIPYETMPDPFVRREEGPLADQRWAQTIWRTSSTVGKLAEAFPDYIWEETKEDGITYRNPGEREKWALDPATPEFKDILDLADEILIGGASTIAGKLSGGAAALLAAATTGPAAPATVPAAYLSAERLATGAVEAAGEAARQFGSNLLGYSDGYDTGDITTAGAVGLMPLPFSSPGLTKGTSQSLMRQGYDPRMVSQPIKTTIAAADSSLPGMVGGKNAAKMWTGKKYVPDVPAKTGKYIPGVRTLEKKYENPLDAATEKFQSDATKTMNNVRDNIWRKMEYALNASDEFVDLGGIYSHLKSQEANFRRRQYSDIGLSESEELQLKAVRRVIKKHFTRKQRVQVFDKKTGKKLPDEVVSMPVTEASPKQAFEIRKGIRKARKYNTDALRDVEVYEQDLLKAVYPEVTNSIDASAVKAVAKNPELATDNSFKNLSAQYAKYSTLRKNLEKNKIVRPDFEDVETGVVSLDNVYGESTRDSANRIMNANTGVFNAKKEGLLNDIATLENVNRELGYNPKTKTWDEGMRETSLSEQAKVIGAFKDWGGPQPKLGNVLLPSLYGMSSMAANPEGGLASALPTTALVLGGSAVGSPYTQKGMMRNPLLMPENKQFLSTTARGYYQDFGQSNLPAAIDLYSQMQGAPAPVQPVAEPQTYPKTEPWMREYVK